MERLQTPYVRLTQWTLTTDDGFEQKSNANDSVCKAPALIP